jgi:nucleotide-binding universal stress UspA family protein
VDKRIVIAVDTGQRTSDALALGRLLATSTGVAAKVVSIVPYLPLADPEDPELVRARDDSARTLSELAAQIGLEDAEVEVRPGNFAARELQHITERPETGLIVVGSTTRGPLGRLVIGGVGERLLAGAACPVAIAPRGYGDEPPAPLARVGVGLDSSDEAHRALEAALTLAERAGAELRVITAFQALAFGGATMTALPSSSANEVMRTELRVVHERGLAAARERVAASGRFTDGTADQVLLQETAELALLVLGSRGYGPLGAVLMGSATAALARGAACPILVTPRGVQFDLLGDL